MCKYNIVRFYFKKGRRVIKSNVTLEEAQEHCSDPETSSNTCTLPRKLQYTKEHGPWFDGYEKI